MGWWLIKRKVLSTDGKQSYWKYVFSDRVNIHSNNVHISFGDETFSLKEIEMTFTDIYKDVTKFMNLEPKIEDAIKIVKGNKHE